MPFDHLPRTSLSILQVENDCVAKHAAALQSTWHPMFLNFAMSAAVEMVLELAAGWKSLAR